MILISQIDLTYTYYMQIKFISRGHFVKEELNYNI